MRYTSAFSFPIALIVITAFAAPCFADNAPAPAFVPKEDAIPDLTQTDPKGKFAGNGKNFCGPVAVSNSLMAFFGEDLRWEEVTHYDVVNQLASMPYMNTHLEKGTNVRQLMRGVERYLGERGEKNYYLKFQGWRRHESRHRTGANNPSLVWIKRLLAGGGAVWINVGWYAKTEEEGEFRRLGGHWVTAVGYGQDAEGTPDASYLLIHDPAPRAGVAPGRQFVKMSRMNSGVLTGVMRNLPRPAKYLYRMEGEMKLRRGAHIALMDGAVGLRLAKKP